ncbi:MAG: hypothetical protein PVJ21_07980 [Anaerolineales bacterium]|jgi:heme-degrading monooxygenase HmoA
MYARVTNTQVVVDKIDEAISVWRDKLAPRLKQAKGFKGVYVMGDRGTGKGLSITLWETKENADATLATQPQSLALFEGLLSGTPSVDTYEVVFQA